MLLLYKMDTTIIPQLEKNAEALEAKIIELEKKKDIAIKLHRESVDCYIGMIELGLWEKKNRIRNNNNNNNYEKEVTDYERQDMELVPILEAILNSIKLLNSR